MSALSGNGGVFPVRLRKMNVTSSRGKSICGSCHVLSEQLICQTCTSKCEVIKPAFENMSSKFFFPLAPVSLCECNANIFFFTCVSSSVVSGGP